MFKKVITILSFLLISACNSKKSYACSKVFSDGLVSIDITSTNDVINSISIRESFTLPQTLIADEKQFASFDSQVSDEYHYEDNLLVKEYTPTLDKKYSLAKTLESLKKERFICE